MAAQIANMAAVVDSPHTQHRQSSHRHHQQPDQWFHQQHTKRNHTQNQKQPSKRDREMLNRQHNEQQPEHRKRDQEYCSHFQNHLEPSKDQKKYVYNSNNLTDDLINILDKGCGRESTESLSNGDFDGTENNNLGKIDTVYQQILPIQNQIHFSQFHPGHGHQPEEYSKMPSQQFLQQQQLPMPQQQLPMPQLPIHKLQLELDDSDSGEGLVYGDSDIDEVDLDSLEDEGLEVNYYYCYC